MVHGSVVEFTILQIGRLEKFFYCRNGHLSESRGYSLLFGFPFVFRGFLKHSLIQIMQYLFMFSGFGNLSVLHLIRFITSSFLQSIVASDCICTVYTIHVHSIHYKTKSNWNMVISLNQLFTKTVVYPFPGKISRAHYFSWRHKDVENEQYSQQKCWRLTRFSLRWQMIICGKDSLRKTTYLEKQLHFNWTWHLQSYTTYTVPPPHRRFSSKGCIFEVLMGDENVR